MSVALLSRAMELKKVSPAVKLSAIALGNHLSEDWPSYGVEYCLNIITEFVGCDARVAKACLSELDFIGFLWTNGSVVNFTPGGAR